MAMPKTGRRMGVCSATNRSTGRDSTDACDNNADLFVKRGGATSIFPRRRRDGALHIEQLRAAWNCDRRTPGIVTSLRKAAATMTTLLVADHSHGLRRAPSGVGCGPTSRVKEQIEAREESRRLLDDDCREGIFPWLADNPHLQPESRRQIDNPH